MRDATDDFALQVRRHAAGVGDEDRLRQAFQVATFYCQAPENPGFLATPTPSGYVIAVFTSERALVRHAGACRWFSTSGADLLALAPVGHRFVVDPGSRHELVVDPTGSSSWPTDRQRAPNVDWSTGRGIPDFRDTVGST